MKNDCARVHHWIEAYLDRELDPVHSLEVEAHAETCASCRKRIESGRALKEAFRDQRSSLYFSPPEGLEEKWVARAGGKSRRTSKSFAAVTTWAAVATLALLAALPNVLTRWTSPEAALREEIVSSHVRSLMGDHLTDVLSSDRHTVKPWFNGKLDYSPTVQDFADRGYPLIGGRLDYLGGKPVASLVYKSDKHPINLYIWPSSEGDSAPRLSSIRGYNLYHWISGGVDHWAVSDLNAVTLQNFVSLVK